MQIKNSTSYILITPNESSITEFLNNFKKEYNSLNNNNLFINLTKLEPLKPVEVNKLLKWATQSRKLKKSFIIIIQNIVVDDVSEELICVPTLLEAKDTLEMEVIERNLGF